MKNKLSTSLASQNFQQKLVYIWPNQKHRAIILNLIARLTKTPYMNKERIIVYTSGTFDMFHSNHLKMINYSKALGDLLIVGVSTDELVNSYKAPPIVPFEERLAILEGMKAPDMVIPQRSLDHSEIVKKLHIDIFVVGDDWTGKYDYLEDFGVKVFYFPYGAGTSSTVLKKKIFESYSEIKKRIDNHDNPDIIKNHNNK